MKKLTKLTFSLLVLIAIFVWAAVVKSPTADVNPSDVNIYFLSVGQGDATLITKGTYQILIDGGPDQSILEELGRVIPVYDKSIEMVVLSHPHADHLAGLNHVLDRYEVRNLYYSGVEYDSAGYSEFKNKLIQAKINAMIPKLDQAIIPYENANLTFLWPEDVSQTKPEQLNNSSMVGRFCYFSNCLFLPGDMETDAQAQMLSKYENKDLESEVLKVSHHGSVNGTSEALLDKLKPTFAIIPVGENGFGHPHQATLDLLASRNIQTFRTDQNSPIRLIFNPVEVLKK